MFEIGDNVHVVTRRGFEGDLRRHFVGRVVQFNDVAVKLEGFVFVHEPARNEFVRRQQRRTRIVSLTDAANVINVIPRDVDLEALSYRVLDKRLVVTDGEGFQLDINEFGATR